MSSKKLVRFDWAIKYILRSKANFDVLEAFLSNLLKEEIKVENIIESESNSDAENRKFNRVDLNCKDSKGRQIIIEIQNQREVDYLQRILWGTSKAVVESLELGESYGGVVKVISISILYHSMCINEKENTDFIYYGTTELVGIHTKEPLKFKESVLEEGKKKVIDSKNVFPEYYMIYVEKFEDMIKEAIDEWVYFFKHGEVLDTFKSPGILLVSKKLDYLMMKEEDKNSYNDYLAYLGQEMGILDTAKAEGIDIGIEIGKVEGIEIGKVEGIEIGKVEGIEIGEVKGKIEEKVQIAKNLLDVLDDETIALKTGLEIKTVVELRLKDL